MEGNPTWADDAINRSIFRVDAVLVDFVAKDALGGGQDARGGGHVAAGGFEGIDNNVAFVGVDQSLRLPRLTLPLLVSAVCRVGGKW
jgi:hypothetical protein